MMKSSSADMRNFDSDFPPPEVSQAFIENKDFKNKSFGILLHILNASNCEGKYTKTSVYF